MAERPSLGRKVAKTPGQQRQSIKLGNDVPNVKPINLPSYDYVFPPEPLAPLRVVTYFSAQPQSGMGHKYRCLALAQELKAAGHSVRSVHDEYQRSRDQRTGLTFDSVVEQEYPDYGGVVIPAHPPEQDEAWIRPGLATAMRSERANWLVVDLPHTVPDWVYAEARANNCKIVQLNGVGHNLPGEQADIVWVQDTPQTVILRKKVLQLVREPVNDWIVFGGSADELGLRSAFIKTGLPGTILETWHNERIQRGALRPGQFTDLISDSEIMYYLVTCKAALIHMGMIAWELAVLGVPTFAVSRTPEHLKFALNMQELGLLRAYPKVGLPSDRVLKAFLKQDFQPNRDNAPDGHAAERLIAKMLELTDV